MVVERQGPLDPVDLSPRLDRLHDHHALLGSQRRRCRGSGGDHVNGRAVNLIVAHLDPYDRDCG